MKNKHPQPLTPAGLYATVSSDHQDGDLSVSAQLRALKDYAKANGYSVARVYIDEAESGRVANRPQFREMIEEGSKPKAPFRGHLGLEIQPLHQEARARRGLQVPAAAQGHPVGVHHRAGRGQSHRQAACGNHRERRLILLGKFGAGGRPGDVAGRCSSPVLHPG